ncbi:MAG: hypothetical protein Q7Q73_02285 [Verrucomicrobiota bacterium JB024]|nr:hypothetical protein [Verrucomicrobiota bacterium JB024]
MSESKQTVVQVLRQAYSAIERDIKSRNLWNPPSEGDAKRIQVCVVGLFTFNLVEAFLRTHATEHFPEDGDDKTVEMAVTNGPGASSPPALPISNEKEAPASGNSIRGLCCRNNKRKDLP